MADCVPVTSPIRLPEKLVADVAVDAFPMTLPVTFPASGPENPEAVIVPALKFPLASRATIAFAVLVFVAVVAELLTFPEDAMVANFESRIAAEAEISALNISPSPILALLMALSATSAEVIVPSKILALVTASSFILAAVTAKLAIFTVLMAAFEITGAEAVLFVPLKSPAN